MSNPSNRAAAPLVSLGLPVFNGERFLARALDTVLSQTYADFELIISDNASTDATPDIVREYAARDPRLRPFRQRFNIGIGNNWSFVAQMARGTLFKWISSNDEYAPTLLEKCVSVMARDPTVALCYGLTQFIDEAGNRLDVHVGDFSALSDDPVERYRVVRRKLHLSTSIQSGVVRLDAVRRCGFMGNYRDSDRVLIAGLALEGKFVLLPEVLFYRRWGRTVATPLRTPLEVEQMYRPQARRAPYFFNVPRQVGQLQMALMAPRGWHEKMRCLFAALRYTDWEEKLVPAVFRDARH
ncbi:MAG TPA: glycosyltransferase family 2 protein [Burkholderiaceae bacterium]|nr:glycosyltransferase family 2 protein [Burkholderiaceae bacterium]